MAYMWGEITRDVAEEKLEAAGCEPGQFLVRSRGEKYPGSYVLCVAYKGKPTHHLAVPNEDGELVLNKKTFGSNKTLEELIAVLATKPQGWPVALTKPITRNSRPSKSNSTAESRPPRATMVPGVGKVDVFDETTPKKKAPKAAKGKKKSARPKWLHGNIAKEEAAELVNNAGATKGQFLVRSRAGKKTEFVLCVAYKGKATHHLIKKSEEGFYVINGKNYGDNTKLQGLIKHLSKPGVPNWPVQLTDAVVRRDQADEADEAASKEPEPAADIAEENAKKPEVEPEKEPEPEASDDGASEEAAAIKIQAQFRGHQVRKSVVELAGRRLVSGSTSVAKVSVDKPAADNNNTAAPVEPAKDSQNSPVQRTLLRAVIALNTKMSKYEGDIASMMAELDGLEKAAVAGVAAAQAQAQAQAQAAQAEQAASDMILNKYGGAGTTF